MAANPDEPNESERAFLDASRAAAVAARERELRARRRLHRAFVTAAVVAVLALVAGALAFQQRRTARASADEARRQRSAAIDAAAAAETSRLAALAPNVASTDLSLSMLLAAEADRRSTSPETLGALQQVLVAADESLGFLFTDEPLRRVFAPSPDRWIGFGEQSIYVWDAASGQRLAKHALSSPVADRGLGSTYPVDVGWPFAAWVDRSATVRLLALDGSGPEQGLGPGVGVAIDRSGSRLAVAGLTGELAMYALPSVERLWDVPGDGGRTYGDLITNPERRLLLAAVLDTPADGILDFADDGQTLARMRVATASAFDAQTGGRLWATDTTFADGGVQTTGRSIGVPAADPGIVLATGPYDVAAFDRSDGSLRWRHAALALSVTLLAGAELTRPGQVAVLQESGQIAFLSTDTGEHAGEPVNARVGRAVDLAVTADGLMLLVAGDHGLAIRATDGAGPLNRAIERPDDQFNSSALADARWVSTDPQYPLPGQDLTSETSISRVWRCADPGCSPVTSLPLTGNQTVSLDAPAGLVMRYVHNPETFRDSFELWDPATMILIAPPIDLGGFNVTHEYADREKGWVIFGTYLPNKAEAKDLRTGAVLFSEAREGSGSWYFAADATRGTVLATLVETGESILIDTATWQKRPTPLPLGAASLAAYSQDGSRLVTIAPDGTISLRNPETFAEIRRLNAQAGASNSVAWQQLAFSDDGRYLVTSHDSRGRLWDLDSGQLIGQVIESPLESSKPVSVPGHTVGLVTLTEEWIKIWRFDPSTWREIACRAAGRNMTAAEWAQFGPRDQPHRATCEQWPLAS